MSILFLLAFLLAISIIFGAFKLLGTSRSITKTTSALNSLHWFQFSNELFSNWLLLSTVHSNTSPLYLSYLLHPYTPSHQLNTSPQYLSYLLHPYTPSHPLVLPPSISSPNLNIALSSRGFRHAGPSLWNSLPHHLRSIDSYNVFKSNLKLTFSLVQASLAPDLVTVLVHDLYHCLSAFFN